MAWRKKNVQHVYVILANFFCILNPLLLKTDSFFFHSWKAINKKRCKTRVSVQGVESLWGDCRFIPGGHSSRFGLFCSF